MHTSQRSAAAAWIHEMMHVCFALTSRVAGDTVPASAQFLNIGTRFQYWATAYPLLQAILGLKMYCLITRKLNTVKGTKSLM